MRSTQMFKSMKELQEITETPSSSRSDYILIIQQDPLESKQIRRYLENLGYSVKDVVNGIEALNTIKKTPPALIISDISIQGMKGYELCQILKNEPSTSSIPFMFITSSVSTPDKIIGFQQGGDDYITKPFEPGEIKVRVESLLKRFRSRKAISTIDTVPQSTATAESKTQKEALRALKQQSERFRTESDIAKAVSPERSQTIQEQQALKAQEPRYAPPIKPDERDAGKSMKAVYKKTSGETDLDDFLDSIMQREKAADVAAAEPKERVKEVPKTDIPKAEPPEPVEKPAAGPAGEALRVEKTEPAYKAPKVHTEEIPEIEDAEPAGKTVENSFADEAEAEVEEATAASMPEISEAERLMPFEDSPSPRPAAPVSAERIKTETRTQEPRPGQPIRHQAYPGIDTERIIRAQASAKLKMPARKQIMDAPSADVYQYALEIYRRLIEAGGDFGSAEFHTIISLCEKMTEIAIANNDLLKLALRRSEGKILEIHNLNACIIAMVTGKNLGLPARELVLLSMAGLLFDIGMIKVNPKIFTKKGEISTKDRSSIQRHVEYGAETIEHAIKDEFPQECKYITTAILQHHERESGQGYPKKLKGDQIAQSAKIIGLADTYEAMCHVRFYRDRQTTYRALQEVVAMKKIFFDSGILRALVNELTFFPPGCYVRLNTDEIGIVIDTTSLHSMRPKVKILVDSEGAPLPAPKIIDLVDSPFIYIAKAIDDADLVNIPE